ncbi:allantoinase PuuE [Limibacillus sp. MBR-115]|jgi:putative urate catabolism protein|uniref:allantoinase PuuE n=1 Tax=Limibacillus sp. MBR-115 TaxID=3156465 RepID=UPI003396A858
MKTRDLVGYGRTPPDPRWPEGARLAVQIVVNYEEGGEKSVLYGDAESESFLLEQPTLALKGIRNLSAESQYEYGSRAGFWRLFKLLTGRQVPVTVFGVATALAQNPEAVVAMKESDWEIASHGMRWRSYADMPRDEERREIERAIELHTEVTGERPLGWYTGGLSPSTRELVVEAGGFLYESNSFSDDLPYWVDVDGKQQLIIPYCHDTNDMRYLMPFGFQSTFSEYLCGAFDFLYRESRGAPKMMNVGLHCRISGRPGRAAELERFLDYALKHEGVWFTKRIDIARHWHTHHGR